MQKRRLLCYTYITIFHPLGDVYKRQVQSLFTSSTGSSANNNTSSGDDTQMTYTKDELKKAISEKESQLRNLKLDQKEEELKVKNTQKSLDSQTVKATISGVVTVSYTHLISSASRPTSQRLS